MRFHQNCGRPHPKLAVRRHVPAVELPLKDQFEGGFRGDYVRSFRYLVYLNNTPSGKRIVKTIDLCDQKTAP